MVVLQEEHELTRESLYGPEIHELDEDEDQPADEDWGTGDEPWDPDA